MKLGDFRKQTAHLPDDTDILLPEIDMPGHRDAGSPKIGKVSGGMGGPYCVTPEQERKYPHLYKDCKTGIFF